MAKRQAVIIEDGTETDDRTRQEEELEQANEDTDGELLRSLQEMSGTAGVSFLFTRTYPNTPDSLGFVGEMTPAEFSLDRVREVYGPGHYRVRVKGPKGFLPGGGTIRVAKGLGTPPPGAAPGGSGAADFASLLRAMNEREELRRKEESERRGRLLELTIPAGITALASMVAAFAGRSSGPDITGLITALKPPPPPPPLSITDLTTALTNIKELSGGKDNSQVDVLFKVLDLAKDHFGGGDKGESNWIDIVRDLLKEGPALVQPLLENLRAQQNAVAAGTPMTVAPVPARANSVLPPSTVAGVSAPTSPNAMPTPGVTPATPSDGTDMNVMIRQMIAAQTAKLLAWAQADKRVDLYAEVLLDELPAMVHNFVKPEQALQYLRDPTWFEVVKGFEPALAAHRDWLDAMRLELIDIITEQLEGEGKPASGQIVDDNLNGESPE